MGGVDENLGVNSRQVASFGIQIIWWFVVDGWTDLERAGDSDSDYVSIDDS